MKYPLEKASHKITLLFLSWRDIKAPKKGGAEIYTHEMLSRVDKAKFRIIHISPLFPGGREYEEIDGVTYLRQGNALTVLWFAFRYYRQNKHSLDYVVDQCNTHRFFTKFWVPASKRIFFIHQLTREIWHIHAKFPFNWLGYWTETPFLRLSRRDYTMTVSPSTQKDLLDVGFDQKKTFIIPEGISFQHWQPEEFLTKEENPTFIYVGRYAYYKGIDATFAAFGELKARYPAALLWLVGKKDEVYIRETLHGIMKKYQLTGGEPGDGADITFYGFVSDEEKLQLMSRAHALMFPSLREGWGLIVTEAAAVGTPSIVYYSPGVVDAVDFGRAGYVTGKNTVTNLVSLMEQVIVGEEDYERMRRQAYEYAKEFHWDKTAAALEAFIGKLNKERGGRHE